MPERSWAQKMILSSIGPMSKKYFLMIGRKSGKTWMLKRYLEEMMGMEKFEAGDKVRMTRLDTTNNVYISGMKKHLGQIGQVHDVTENGRYMAVAYGENMGGFYYPVDWFELVEKRKPDYWNGQFIVVGECQTKSLIHPKMQPVTVGKVYELKDGKATLDDGRVIQNYNYKTFDDFASRLRDLGVRIIEFKGFCRNKGKEQNE